MSKPKFVSVLLHIGTTLIFTAAVFSMLVASTDIRFKSRYELPRRLRLHLNGGYFVPTIYINDEIYVYRYFSESTSEEYLDVLPDTFNELPHEENDLKIVSGYIRGLDEDFKETWLPVKKELTGSVYMSDYHPNVALLYFDVERRSDAFSEPNRYYYLIKSDLLDAEVVYKNHDYEFNFLTHCYTPEYLPKDLRELPTGSITVNDNFLRDQPAYTSGKTGMIYIEVFEDTVYIPFERPKCIQSMLSA